MTDAQFNEINRKLEMLIRLSAMQIVKDMEYRQQITVLDKIGMQPKEMSDIVGKSTNNIAVTLHLIKKKSKGGKKDEQQGNTGEA
jgi:hypothetical protein